MYTGIGFSLMIKFLLNEYEERLHELVVRATETGAPMLHVGR